LFSSSSTGPGEEAVFFKLAKLQSQNELKRSLWTKEPKIEKDMMRYHRFLLPVVLTARSAHKGEIAANPEKKLLRAAIDARHATIPTE